VRKTNATVVLVLGIVSLFGPGCLAGIPAWIIGNTTIREIDTLGGDPSDRNLAVIGKTIGMVTTILSLGGLLLVVFLQLVFGVAFFSAQNHATFHDGNTSIHMSSGPNGDRTFEMTPPRSFGD
jgi:hypothetical protein